MKKRLLSAYLKDFESSKQEANQNHPPASQQVRGESDPPTVDIIRNERKIRTADHREKKNVLKRGQEYGLDGTDSKEDDYKNDPSYCGSTCKFPKKFKAYDYDDDEDDDHDDDDDDYEGPRSSGRLAGIRRSARLQSSRTN
ncbi:hypothetical protein OROGR_027672 [Orobanche gracilis]